MTAPSSPGGVSLSLQFGIERSVTSPIYFATAARALLGVISH